MRLRNDVIDAVSAVEIGLSKEEIDRIQAYNIRGISIVNYDVRYVPESQPRMLRVERSCPVFEPLRAALTAPGFADLPTAKVVDLVFAEIFKIVDEYREWLARQ